jgi:hypothetical protein
MRLTDIATILEELGIDNYSVKIPQKELYIHKENDYRKLQLTKYVIKKDGELYIGDYKVIYDTYDVFEDSYFEVEIE